jgi:hypothetical protein
VLALSDFSKTFQVHTDASDAGVGAVLTQDNHPIAFISKSLGPRTCGMSTYEKEYLAVLIAVDHWRSYLQHAEFVIVTDHRSLIHLSDQRLHTQWQQKLYTKLVGLQYRIVYRPGSSNQAVDALSRHPNPPAILNAVSSSSPHWLEDVSAGYLTDSFSATLLQELSAAADSRPPYTLHSGIIRFHDRIWIGDNPAVQQRIISALHSSALGGHSGFPVTYSKMKKLFAWKGMKSAVRSFIQNCTICIQAKPDRSKYPGC